MELLKTWVNNYNAGAGILAFEEIHALLGCSKIFAEVYISELCRDGFIQLTGGGWAASAYTLTDKAKFYAIEQNWITE
ncbi:hypothetical protein [Vibrio sagamiensis]|uniref:Uncharacterized protein n=1 Tax=Vibrio sagamiensis NBRC 104589 TaxID=1219064 RepID=A0A511QFP6_9VIBR|nr:hypothetical protein [Vibrio sagamiensis]PNQ58947.1 hypothetical protein C1141_12720 [Vibrio agarivorans]GEM76114.1 hypothetical protein VSA01S_22260 [Vibrio sagamiensis NBRC 104589]